MVKSCGGYHMLYGHDIDRQNNVSNCRMCSMFFIYNCSRKEKWYVMSYLNVINYNSIQSMFMVFIIYFHPLYFVKCCLNKVVNWGSSKQTQQIKAVITNTYKANTIQYHVKNYVPNIMVLSGEPEIRKELVHLAHLITNKNGLQVCVNVKKVRYIYIYSMFKLWMEIDKIYIIIVSVHNLIKYLRNR